MARRAFLHPEIKFECWEDCCVRLSQRIDVEAQLRRIAACWEAVRKPCSCGPNQACNVCELDHLIEEAFEPIEEGRNHEHDD